MKTALLVAVLQAVPLQWRGPVASFLDHKIDAPTLRQRLEGRSGAAAAEPPDVTAAYARATTGDFASASPAEQARAYGELDLVLQGLLPDDQRAPIARAAAESRRRVAASRQARVDAAIRRAALALERAPKEAAVPFVPERPPMPVEDALEIELPWLREAWESARLDQSGAVALDEHGYPEAEAYRAAATAALMLADRALTAAIPPAGLALIEKWAQVHARTVAAVGAANPLSAAHYAEPTPGGFDLSIREFVRTERFKTPKWWAWSSQGYAEVTAATSQSPFVKHLGPGSRSTLYWAAVPDGGLGRPDPLGMRLRVNLDAQGLERTLEVLAPVGRDDDGSPRWKGFFFKKIGGEWVPGDPRRAPETQKCIACHYTLTAKGERKLTPLPVQLRGRSDLLQVGYKDAKLVEDYLKIIAAH